MKPPASDGKQRWAKAQVQKQVDVKSYAVRTEDGRLFRRNRRHLRQSKEQFVAKDPDVEILSPVTNCPPTEVYTEPSAAPAQNSTEDPTPLHSKQTGQGLPIIRPTPSSAECQKNSAVTRSGRSVRPPSYLKDYVQTQFFYCFLLRSFEMLFYICLHLSQFSFFF